MGHVSIMISSFRKCQFVELLFHPELSVYIIENAPVGDGEGAAAGIHGEIDSQKIPTPGNDIEHLVTGVEN